MSTEQTDKPGTETDFPVQLYRAAFDAMPDSAALLDEQGRLLAVNEAWRNFARANGGDPDAYVGRNYLDILDAACGDPGVAYVSRMMRDLLAGIRQNFDFECQCELPDGIHWYLMRVLRVHLDGQVFFMSLYVDITQRRKAEERAREVAGRDLVTGLLNRRSLLEQSAILERIAAREQRDLVALFLDLDGFKPVNDRLGHKAGDQVLQQVADRLRAVVRSSDVLARYGGDEFVIVGVVQGSGDGRELADRCLAVFSEPIDVGVEKLQLSCSIGLVEQAIPDEGIEQLVNRADYAMYRVKMEGGNGVHCARPDEGMPFKTG